MLFANSSPRFLVVGCFYLLLLWWIITVVYDSILGDGRIDINSAKQNLINDPVALNAINDMALSPIKRGDLFHPVSLTNLTSNSTNVTSPIAPLYHNVSVGVAWGIPASTYDLGARGMTCECFDPDRKLSHPQTFISISTL